MTTTNISINLAGKFDGSETKMLAILVDSWGDKLVIPLTIDEATGNGVSTIEAIEYFNPCAHCGNAVLDCNFENGSDCCDRCNEGHGTTFRPANKIQTANKTYAYLKEDMTEEIIQTMDECVHTKFSTCTGTCWISDICTKREELRQFAIFQKLQTQTLPEDVMEPKKFSNASLHIDFRIRAARQEAEDAFWAVIVKHFPEANDGSFLMSDMEDIMLSWVKHWVDCNVPSQASYRGELLELKDMKLHYEDTWHMFHTGGNCYAAATDNVAVHSEYHYLVIADSYVCVYVDNFVQDDFMQKSIASWAFGDNPCVLMNILDEFMGGNCLWNTAHLFEDIMKLGYSGRF